MPQDKDCVYSITQKESKESKIFQKFKIILTPVILILFAVHRNLIDATYIAFILDFPSRLPFSPSSSARLTSALSDEPQV